MLNSTKISKAENSRFISDLSPKELIQLISYCSVLTGFDLSRADEIQVMVFVDFFRNNYTDITIDEIKLAFQMAITGKLDVETRHFQQFSPLYISQIIEAYKLFKSKIKDKKQMKEITQEVPLTPSQLYEKMKDNFEGLVDYFEKHNEPPIGWNWDEAFLYAEKRGLINLSKAEKQKLYGEVKNNFERAYKAKTHRIEKIQFGNIFLKNNSIITECRKMLLVSFLTKKIRGF